MEVAAIIIRRPSGEFFVHKRASDRKSYPNLFGLGAGGKIEAGESPQTGAMRELFEETGISAQPQFLFSFDFAEAQHKYRMHIFELITDQNVKPDAREWQWSGWIEASKLASIANEGNLCPDTAIFYRRYLDDHDKSFLTSPVGGPQNSATAILR